MPEPDNNEQRVPVSLGMSVRGPFIECPKCGAMTFGILIIDDHRYLRRCKKCFYPTPKEGSHCTSLPRLNKRVIYLDQFVVSKIAYSLNPTSDKHGKDHHHDFWLRVFEKCDSLAKMQLIVCPDSEFHQNESLPSKDFEDFRTIYRHLSYGVSFKDREHIQRWQILRSFRHWLLEEPSKDLFATRDDYLAGDRSAWTGNLQIDVRLPNRPEFVKELIRVRGEIDEGIRQVFANWQEEQGREFDDWVLEEIGGAYKSILSSARSSVESFLPTSGAILLHEIERHLEDNQYPRDEWVEIIHRYFASNCFAYVPLVSINAAIWAATALRAKRGKKDPPTRGFSTDVRFVSAFLPFCDAIFVDNDMRSILLSDEVRTRIGDYSDRVFSLDNKDEFIEYLDAIAAGASEDHLRLFDEIYGDDYLQPYSTILTDQ